MSHWEYCCIEDPTDGDDEYISGDAMRDDRDVNDELDALMDKIDDAIENAREMLRDVD